ncbi:MAG: helix-turn-helix domain-containing protein [Patescibacteria group bacterium]
MEEFMETKTVVDIIGDAMKSKSMSIEKLAQLTGISERFLESMVKENTGKLPSAPYMRGYFSRIADTLNLNGELLWSEYQRQTTVQKFRDKQEPTRGTNKEEWIKKFMNTKTLIVIVVGLGILLVILWRGPAFIGKPTLALDHFDDNISVTTSSFVVKGKIDPKNQLTINDEVVFPDDTGAFEKSFTLAGGFNTFNFKVKGILGKELDVTKQVYLSTSTKKGDKQVENKTSTSTQ